MPPARGLSVEGSRVPHGFGHHWQPEAGELRLRAATIVLILLNLALGIALLELSQSVATIVDGPARCCRGEGPEAYCCRSCCWLGPYCRWDSNCRETSIE